MSSLLSALSILDSDSYKPSHWKQYPPKTTWMMSYFESRGGKGDFTVFFGLQYILKTLKTPTMEDVHTAKRICKAHGEDFNFEGWKRIAELGYWPVKIKAVPEGTVVAKKNVLMTIESTDSQTFWVVSWLETLLVRIWYMQNVATLSYRIRLLILSYLRETSEKPEEEILFKLHNFGSRGSSCREAAAISDMAHTLSFLGTDTMAGLVFSKEYYGCEMSGFSIPASEHSTMTMWGRENEAKAYSNMIDQYAGEGKLYACVSDSYDLYNAISNIWGGELKDKVLSAGGTLVVRPDSGFPPDVCLKSLELLSEKFGYSFNKKGYKVLPDNVRVIYGDGINYEMIHAILIHIKEAKFSATNVGFGMGGALVQQHDRDTHEMAFKCCAAVVDGQLVEVYKDPKTGSGKTSKAGILDLIKKKGWTDYPWQAYETVKVSNVGHRHPESVLRVVYSNGKLFVDETLDEIRNRLWK